VQELRIDKHVIGAGRPTFVIAEIGVNHDGSASRAIELACLAAAGGADAVKLQLFSARRLMHPSTAFAGYQKQRVADATPADMLARYQLTTGEVRDVVAAVRDLGLVPMATPFSPEDVGLIEQLGLSAVKIASPDLVNRPLLSRAAQLGKPLLVSTGAATMEEVATSVSWLNDLDVPFALLHCVSSYPAPVGQANLCWIGEMAGRFDVPVGYSDHTTSAIAGAVAVAHGAVIVERHLTYDRSAEGPDHAASSDPTQFARYVKHIREADALRGAPGKRVLEVEKDVRSVSRQSLVTVRPLGPDEAVRASDLTVQRPGTGIPAAAIDQVVGRRVRRAVPAGAMLQWSMIRAAAAVDAA
jgi:N,N'-diacetyllegionaminate synthase